MSDFILMAKDVFVDDETSKRSSKVITHNQDVCEMLFTEQNAEGAYNTFQKLSKLNPEARIALYKGTTLVKWNVAPKILYTDVMSTNELIQLSKSMCIAYIEMYEHRQVEQKPADWIYTAAYSHYGALDNFHILVDILKSLKPICDPKYVDSTIQFKFNSTLDRLRLKISEYLSEFLDDGHELKMKYVLAQEILAKHGIETNAASSAIIDLISAGLITGHNIGKPV